MRRDTGTDGKPWETVMQNDYGYIRGTEGVDGDHIDVFLSDTPEEGDVFVVDQVNEDGSFDEHKVMYMASPPKKLHARHTYPTMSRGGAASVRLPKLAKMSSKNGCNPQSVRQNHSPNIRVLSLLMETL